LISYLGVLFYFVFMFFTENAISLVEIEGDQSDEEELNQSLPANATFFEKIQFENWENERDQRDRERFFPKLSTKLLKHLRQDIVKKL
jgi:hypothetical protein